MSDTYFGDVVYEVWKAGGNPDAVPRERTEMCEAAGIAAEEVAGYELQWQAARQAVERDIAAWNARHAH